MQAKRRLSYKKNFSENKQTPWCEQTRTYIERTHVIWSKAVNHYLVFFTNSAKPLSNKKNLHRTGLTGLTGIFLLHIHLIMSSFQIGSLFDLDKLTCLFIALLTLLSSENHIRRGRESAWWCEAMSQGLSSPIRYYQFHYLFFFLTY